MTQKTLISLSAYPDLVFSIEKTINEEEFGESSMVEREFKLWLAKQVDENGIVLNDKIILSKIYALKNIEKMFQTPVFDEVIGIASTLFLPTVSVISVFFGTFFMLR